MLKKFMLIFLICSFYATVSGAESSQQVEIFNINKGKVIKEVPVNQEIHSDIVTIFNGINDIYRAFEPIPKKGHMVKIPLEPAIHLENEWFNDLVSEVILIFPEYENPHLMVFDNENQAYFFNFKAPVDNILKELDLKLKGQRE